jgi:hypothetical protein
MFSELRLFFLHPSKSFFVIFVAHNRVLDVSVTNLAPLFQRQSAWSAVRDYRITTCDINMELPPVAEGAINNFLHFLFSDI